MGDVDEVHMCFGRYGVPVAGKPGMMRSCVDLK